MTSIPRLGVCFVFAMSLFVSEILAESNQTPPSASSTTTQEAAAEAHFDWKLFAPNILSILAFFISLYVLWATHLRPFKPMIVVGNPELRIYRIEQACDGTETDGWWIPSINLDLSVCNIGSRPGRFDDIRLVFDGRRNRHVFYPQWIVDFPRYKAANDRNDWLGNAIKSDWLPIMVLPKASVSYHVVCEGGRWTTVPEDSFCIYIEYYLQRDRKWCRYDSFPFSIGGSIKEHLEKGNRFGLGSAAEHRSEQSTEGAD